MTNPIIKALIEFIFIILVWETGKYIGQEYIWKEEPVEIGPSPEKMRADSLSKVLDSLSIKLYEDSVVFAELKKNHRNEISTIDTLTIHEVFIKWTGQHKSGADSAKRRAGTAGGLYK